MKEEAKNRDARGAKQDKQHITLLLGCSMSGEKLPPIVIVQFKNPTGFRHSRLPLRYYNTKQAGKGPSRRHI